MRSQDVIKRLRSAFPSEAPPAARSMAAEEGRKDLGGRRWTEPGLPTLRRNHESLFFMPPAQVVYWLPAFLVATLRYPRRAGNLVGSIAFTLTKPGAGAYRKRYSDWTSLLNEEQRAAVAAFIERFLVVHGDNAALARSGRTVFGKAAKPR